MTKPDMPKSSKSDVSQDAKGQFAKSEADSTNNGVHSAKPRDITHSDDATMHKDDPLKQKKSKDWDINYDERSMNEGSFRG